MLQCSKGKKNATKNATTQRKNFHMKECTQTSLFNSQQGPHIERSGGYFFSYFLLTSPWIVFFNIFIIPSIPQIWHYCICSASLSDSENTKTVFLLLQLVSSFVKFMLTTHFFFFSTTVFSGTSICYVHCTMNRNGCILQRTNLARK